MVKIDKLLADKAYDVNNWVSVACNAQNVKLVVPSKSRCTEPIADDKHLHKARHLDRELFR